MQKFSYSPVFFLLVFVVLFSSCRQQDALQEELSQLKSKKKDLSSLIILSDASTVRTIAKKHAEVVPYLPMPCISYEGAFAYITEGSNDAESLVHRIESFYESHIQCVNTEISVKDYLGMAFLNHYLALGRFDDAALRQLAKEQLLVLQELNSREMSLMTATYLSVFGDLNKQERQLLHRYLRSTITELEVKLQEMEAKTEAAEQKGDSFAADLYGKSSTRMRKDLQNATAMLEAR
ncbi:MAG: hypothetical protein JJT94_10665 [Bernardetiaceae bacterium]|nr:hypothetical protein [Bernardetiaceae bacterium]